MNIPQISSQQTLTTPLQVVSNNTSSTIVAAAAASSSSSQTTTSSLINLSTNSNTTTTVPLELLTSVNTAHILKTTPHMTNNVRCFITQSPSSQLKPPQTLTTTTTQLRATPIFNLASPTGQTPTIKLESNENGQISIVNTKKIIRTTSTTPQPASNNHATTIPNLTTLTSLTVNSGNSQQSTSTTATTTKVVTATPTTKNGTSLSSTTSSCSVNSGPTQSSQASSAPKLIITNPTQLNLDKSATNRILTTQIQTNSNSSTSSNNTANLRVISAPSNLTIHQIALSNQQSNSISPPPPSSLSSSHTASASITPSATTTSINLKTINSTKLNETLNTYTNKIRTQTPTSNLNIIKTATINKLTPTSTSQTLIEAHTATKIAEAKLISFINTTAGTSISDQIQNKPQTQQHSPSSSPLKPNIIRKTKHLIDVRETNLSSTDQTQQSTQATSILKTTTTTTSDNDSVIVDLRPKTINTPNFSIISNQANKSQSKKIVNISRCVTPPLTTQINQTQVAIPVPLTKINQITSNSTTLATIRIENIDNVNKTLSQVPILASTTDTLIPSNLNAEITNKTDKQIDTKEQSTENTLINSVPRKRRKQDLKKINDDINKKQLNPLHINGLTTLKKQDNILTNIDSLQQQQQQQQHQLNDDFYLDEQYDEIDDNDDSIVNNSDLDLSPPPNKITKLNTKLNSIKKLNNKNSPLLSKQLKTPTNSKYISKQPTKTLNFIDDDTIKKLSMDFEYIDSNGIRWISKRIKPKLSLLKSNKQQWKTRHNHYVHYSDIKLNDENKTLDELILEKERLENLNDWKIHLIFTQIKEMISYENESLNLLAQVDDYIRTLPDTYSNKIQTSLEANSQRHRLIQKQLNEAQLLLEHLFSHKETFNEILNKTNNYSSTLNKLNLTTQNSTNGYAASDCTSTSTASSGILLNCDEDDKCKINTNHKISKRGRILRKTIKNR